ncbi:MAG: hypothetical protein JWP44_4774 [Mucilaginibacter sp.]|nr:hypothetical protein [Mucilaginibacter sp.]
MGIFAGLRARARGQGAGARGLERRVVRTQMLLGVNLVEEADTELREVLRLCLADPSIGADHQVTCQARSRLARVLFAAGDYARARSEAEAVLAAGLGPGPVRDRVRLEAREMLAHAVNVQGQHALAAAHFERIAKEYRDAHGARHPLVLKARSDRAQCLLQIEGFEAEAEVECRTILSVSGRRDSVSRLLAGAVGNGLAYALTLQGRHAEAEGAAREALRAVMKADAVSGSARLVTVIDVTLATALSGQGRDQEALALMDAVWQSDEPAPGAGRTDAGAVELARATAFLGLGRYDEAEAGVRHALDEMSCALGPEHRRVAKAKALLDEISVASASDGPGRGDR